MYEPSTDTEAGHDASPIILALATACLIWYSTVAVVSSLGFIQLWRYYSSPLPTQNCPADAPHITIIRPVSGLEPCLYDCLASTFRQTYSKGKLHVRFCIANRAEPALPILQRLLRDFAEIDAQILVEDEDEVLLAQSDALGPNPKIRNMSHAYREAPSDIVWIIDCNVWVATGVCARMVAKLQGTGSSQKYKFVHQLPLVVDTEGTTLDEELDVVSAGPSFKSRLRSTSTTSHDAVQHDTGFFSKYGGRLEECFMSSAHPKFYTAINTVLIAPCVVGKSTMFRRSHLNSLTDGQGIDFFSENICEDHLIGDRIWKGRIPEEQQGEKWGKHALCFGDLAIQPMANMSIREYWSRRVRWLRVRKFTVLLATFVEPGTESFLCALYGAFAFTTLPFFNNHLNIPQTWSAFALSWLFTVATWCLVDRILYLKLHSAASIQIDQNTPSFARPAKSTGRRPFNEWLLSWLGREALALPIWMWAFWGGTRVEWRGKKFWVGIDMKVHRIATDEEEDALLRTNGAVKKKRRD